MQEVNCSASPLQVLAEVCSNASPASSLFNRGVGLTNEDLHHNDSIGPSMPTPVEETNDFPPLLLTKRVQGNPMHISNFLDGPEGPSEISSLYSSSPRWNARSPLLGVGVELHGVVGEVTATSYRHHEPYPSSRSEREQHRAMRRTTSSQSSVENNAFIPANITASGVPEGAGSRTSTSSRRCQPPRQAMLQTEDAREIDTALSSGETPGNKNSSSPPSQRPSAPARTCSQSRKKSQSTKEKSETKKKSVPNSSKQEALGSKATGNNTRVKGRRNLTPKQRKDFGYNERSLMLLSLIDPNIAGCLGCRRLFRLDGRQALKDAENHYIGFILKHIPVCPEIPLESKISTFLDYQALTGVLSKRNESALSKLTTKHEQAGGTLDCLNDERANLRKESIDIFKCGDPETCTHKCTEHFGMLCPSYVPEKKGGSQQKRKRNEGQDDGEKKNVKKRARR